MAIDLHERFRGRPVLITGGLGFIGSNLAHVLAAAGARVLIVDSLVPGCGANYHNVRGIENRVRIVEADLRDARAMAEVVRGRECIFNVAGQVSHLDSLLDPAADMELNCLAHIVLLDACRRVNRDAKIVYASTRQIYGHPASLPASENEPRRPTDFNGVNKMGGEVFHLVFGRIHGIRTSVLRLTNTFGPRQLMKHERQGFIPVFVRRAMDGRTIQLYGDGRQLRDLNYVDDVVETFLLAMDSPRSTGEAYNLGAGQAVSLLEFARLLLEVTGKGSLEFVPFPDEHRRIDIGDYRADIAKIGSHLGWAPRVPLREAVERTVEYYEANKEAYWP